MADCFELVPLKGILNQKFELLKSVNFIANLLVKQELKFVLEFDVKDPFHVDHEGDIQLSIPSKGLKFNFHSKSQLLESITLDIEKSFGFPFLYQGKIVSSSSTTPTFTSIYQLFGPIYPGSWSNGLYHLNYPGITFVFPIQEEVEKGSLPFTNKDGSVPLLKEIIILPDTSLKELVFRDFMERNIVVVKRGVGIFFQSKGFSIDFGFDCQQVLALLGPPRDIFFKKLSSLGIHNSAVSSTGAIETEPFSRDYFWNYFEFGIDFLFDGNRHQIKKIILHSNNLSHPLLLRYNTCSFRFSDCQNGSITFIDSFQDVKMKLGDPMGPGVIHDLEGNPFGPSTFFAFQGGIIIEIGKNERICSLSICYHEQKMSSPAQ